MNSLCKYNGRNTIIHNLDSRIKLIAMIVFMVFAFISYGNGYMNLTIYLAMFIMLGVISLISKSSFLTIFKSLKALWFMIFLLLIINLFFTNDTTSFILFTIPIGKGLDIRLGALIKVSYILIRLIMILMITNIITTTTKPMDLTNSIEWLLTPLKLIKIPVHKFAMAISLALRFVPTLQEEANRVINAQASRGVDYRNGKIKEKLKAITSMIIPLFMSAFTTSGELADAMEARGYDPDSKRTKYRTNHFSFKDVIAIILLAIYLTGMILLAIYKFDIYSLLGVTLPPL